MRKFSTNNTELRIFLEELKIDGVAEGILSKALDGVTKTLGMRWNSFISNVPDEIIEAAKILKAPSKREITRVSSR